MKDTTQHNNWTVYVHINKINGKRYVGITSLNVNNRWRNGDGYKKQVFGRAIAKYGWDNFEHRILATSLTADDANELERALISEWETQNPLYGYNIVDGGNGICGFKFTEESRYKMSVSAKNRNICYANRKKHLPISEETRKKMSINNTGSGNPNYGHKHTADALKKMSKVHSKRVALLGTNGETVKVFESAKLAAEYIGVEKSVVAKCCRGVNRTCKGHRFEYIN